MRCSGDLSSMFLSYLALHNEFKASKLFLLYLNALSPIPASELPCFLVGMNYIATARLLLG